MAADEVPIAAAEAGRMMAATAAAGPTTVLAAAMAIVTAATIPAGGVEATTGVCGTSDAGTLIRGAADGNGAAMAGFRTKGRTIMIGFERRSRVAGHCR
jgi:hypothetical protein